MTERSSPAPQVGQLLSQTEIGAEALIPGAQSGFLLRYSSLDGLDDVTPIEVTGALYIPAGEAPEGGWPLLAWSHGTVGVADVCAPSTAGRSARDLTYLSHWLERGYAIVASDYQGLGTEGVHPYMASRPMAYSTLDGIRAVQQAGFPLTKAVVVTGQSQGASAAIATAGLAASYAPEVDLRAISATGVPYFPPSILAAVTSGPPDEPMPNVTFALYMLTLGELVDPEFVLKDAVSEDVWQVVSQAYEKCGADFKNEAESSRLTPRQIITDKTRGVQDAAFEAMAYPSFELSVPAFIGMGEIDSTTPLFMQQLFVAEACEAGSHIQAQMYSGADHDGGLLQSIPDAELFIDAAFKGGPLPNNCER